MKPLLYALAGVVLLPLCLAIVIGILAVPRLVASYYGMDDYEFAMLFFGWMMLLLGSILGLLWHRLSR